MNKPQLTNTIEKKLLAMIEALEINAKKKGQSLDVKPYLQLADLYKFHKNFKQEADILSRFARHNSADGVDLVDIYARIEKAVELSHLVAHNPEPVGMDTVQRQAFSTEASDLSLQPVEQDKDNINLQTKAKAQPRVNLDKSGFHSQQHYILSACIVTTGRSDLDEVVQVGFELFKYSPGKESAVTALDTYSAYRTPLVAIPNSVTSRFVLKPASKLHESFDPQAVLSLFKQADFVVSHNEAEVERRLLSVLIPEVAEVPWYSSQQDIPWSALGFKSNRLTQLAAEFNEPIPRSCQQRAHAITRLLLKNEPQTESSFLERLYNMQAMKPLQWNETLQKQHKKLLNHGRNRFIKRISIVVAIIAATAIGIMYFL
jgi:hypothetical protein